MPTLQQQGPIVAGGLKYIDIRRVRMHKAPNPWDLCMQQETELMRRIEESGGLESVCCRTGPDNARTLAAWREMPSNGQPFEETKSLLLPVGTLNTDIPVLQFRVPEGFDGIITSVINTVVGSTSFIEANGQLFWRIAFLWSLPSTVKYYARNYGNIITTLGSMTNRYSLEGAGIRIYSNQDVSYLVNCTDGTLEPTARTICSMRGYYWPRK